MTDDTFGSYRRPGAPYLQTTSPTFGGVDGAHIERSVVNTGRTLRSNLLHLVSDLTAGDVDLQGFVEQSRGYIRASYFRAYSLGAISVFPFYTLTDRDIAILDAELREETGFLRAFGRDIARQHLVLDPSARAGLYLLALRGIFERGRVEAMPPGPYRWQLGDTEHCLDCIQAAFDGPYQRSRQDGLGLPVLPGSPGDGSVCDGLTRCGCRVMLSSGFPLPNEEISSRLRGLLLEVAYGSSSVGEGT